MKEITISAISQRSLKLTKEIYDTLYDLASYKHEDRGFSFFIKKSYLEGYLKDVENDSKKYPEILTKKKDEIELIKKLISESKSEIILIDNDGLI